MEQPYTPDPFKNFTPRQNPVKAAVIEDKQPPFDLSALDTLSRPELIELIRTACPDKAQVLLMTEEQRGRAIVDMLAITALTSADRKEARECGKEWLDRTIGKPLQRQMTALAVGVSFTDILAELDGSTADRDGIE